jgi:hypothetical protein
MNLFITREEPVTDRQSRGGKLSQAAIKERLHLRLSLAHSSGRGDIFRDYCPPIQSPLAQHFDSRFVKPEHAPERPFDQMKLVLQNKVWWKEG